MREKPKRMQQKCNKIGAKFPLISQKSEIFDSFPQGKPLDCASTQQLDKLVFEE